MSRVINFEGRKITVPDDATDDEVSQIIGGPAAPTAKPESFGQGVKSFFTGMGKGAFSLPQHAVELGARATDAVGLTDNAYGTVKNVNDDANKAELAREGVAPSSSALKWGEPVGQAIAAAPIAAAFPATLPGVLGSGAVTGALSGDSNHVLEGAALGAGGGAALHGVGRAIAPVISPAVQALADRGVTMSPGQLFGGWAKGLEDRAAGIWPLDGWIKGAQRQSLRDFGTGAGNIAMGGIGPIPDGISGQAMSTTAHKLFDDAYGQVLPQLNVTLDPQFANTVNTAADTVAARLPPSYSDQFQGTLADVFKKMGAGNGTPTNTFGGKAVKDAYSDLGYVARDYQGPTATPNDRAFGKAAGDVQEGIRQSFFNSDPWAAGALGNIDNAYRSFIPVDQAVKSASGNAGGLEAGVFSPGQLRQAVVNADNSVRRTAVSEGGGPLQQFAENGIQVLPSSIGSSGTSERLGLFALPALAASMAAHPVGAAAALAVPALYSKPGLQVLNKLYAHGAGPGATALGGLFQNLGRFGAGPASGALTSGGRQ